MTRLPLLHLLACGLLLTAVAAPADAAESFEGCNGFVTSLPATISTPGVWCLRNDLATAIATGNAITVTSSDVTLDCNHYKLGGLAAGAGTQARGIYADNANHVTVRHCNVRGFHAGVMLDGTGNRVEGTRFDANTSTAIVVWGSDSVVSGNTIHDTGGAPGRADITALMAYGYGTQVTGNDIHGVHAPGDGSGNTWSTGIMANGATIIERNRISGLAFSGEGEVVGIWLDGDGGIVAGNHVLQPSGSLGRGIAAQSGFSFETVCHGNVVKGVAQFATGCGPGTNVHQP